jgi:hypothetical protein
MSCITAHTCKANFRYISTVQASYVYKTQLCYHSSLFLPNLATDSRISSNLIAFHQISSRCIKHHRVLLTCILFHHILSNFIVSHPIPSYSVLFRRVLSRFVTFCHKVRGEDENSIPSVIQSSRHFPSLGVPLFQSPYVSLHDWQSAIEGTVIPSVSELYPIRGTPNPLA